jgi:hypothetical protein
MFRIQKTIPVTVNALGWKSTEMKTFLMASAHLWFARGWNLIRWLGGCVQALIALKQFFGARGKGKDEY